MFLRRSLEENNNPQKIITSSFFLFCITDLLSSVSSVPSLTFMNTSSIVVTDTPKLDTPKSALCSGVSHREGNQYIIHDISWWCCL